MRNRRDKGLFLGLCLLWAGLASAADDFRLLTVPRHIPERGNVNSYVLLCESNRYSFIPPAGWFVRVEAAQRSVIFTSRDHTATLSLTMAEAPAQTGVEPKPEALRELVEGRFPEARVVQEFGCHSGAGSGKAFDLEQTVKSNKVVARRLALVPVSKGRAEFLLVYPPQKTAALHAAFGNMLTSFRPERGPEDRKE
ncbi:MAG: hypothetical protein AB1705_19685 [Verrucomicrobiota bacterium]